MSAILTVEQYKALRGITDSDRDAQFTAALPGAEDAVVNYAQRAFNQAPETATRNFVYENQSILEIDDCQSVTSVKFDGSVLSPESYILGPQTFGAVFYYIELLDYPWASYDPHIDPFLVNINPGRRRRKRVVEVTANFGWATVPASVGDAVALLLDELPSPDSDQSGNLAAEAIVDYSKVFDRPSRTEPPVLPPRVVELLDPFRRVLL